MTKRSQPACKKSPSYCKIPALYQQLSIHGGNHLVFLQDFYRFSWYNGWSSYFSIKIGIFHYPLAGPVYSVTWPKYRRFSGYGIPCVIIVDSRATTGFLLTIASATSGFIWISPSGNLFSPGGPGPRACEINLVILQGGFACFSWQAILNISHTGI